MDRTLAFLSYCVVVYVNRIGAPSITFMFFIRAFILPVQHLAETERQRKETKE